MKPFLALAFVAALSFCVVEASNSRSTFRVNRHNSLTAIPSLEKKSGALGTAISIKGGATPSRSTNNNNRKPPRTNYNVKNVNKYVTEDLIGGDVKGGATRTPSKKTKNDNRKLRPTNTRKPIPKRPAPKRPAPRTTTTRTTPARKTTTTRRPEPPYKPPVQNRNNNRRKKTNTVEPIIDWGGVNKYVTEDLGKMVTKTVEDVTKPGKNPVDFFVRFGDFGNYVTIVLSYFLLMRTPFDLGPCGPGPCDATGYKGNLDPCYVCDGFCISNPTKKNTNSHMLSLYSDLIFTLPLLSLRKSENLNRLGLNAFFLSNVKVFSVAGHGIAHWALSVLTLAGIQVENNPSLRNTIAFLLFLARFANSGTVRQLQNVVDKWEGKRVDPEAEIRLMIENRNSNTLRARVAPVLAGISLALFSNSPPVAKPTLANYVVFGLTCFIFFEAGIPPAPNNWIYSVAFSAIAAWVAVDLLGVSSIQHSFTIVFTSAYLVSSIYQLFVWDKDAKRANPYAYAVSAWGSSVLTTVVGWLLALKCTTMMDIGGHVWYDFSISSSYFLIYYLVKKRAEEKKVY